MKTRVQIPPTANLKTQEQEAKAIYINLSDIHGMHAKETSLFPSKCVIITSTIHPSLQ